MDRVVRLPSKAETENAEQNNRKPWFPWVGSWWKTKKGQLMFKLDLIPDTIFMMQKPKPEETAQDPVEDIDFDA